MKNSIRLVIATISLFLPLSGIAGTGDIRGLSKVTGSNTAVPQDIQAPGANTVLRFTGVPNNPFSAGLITNDNIAGSAGIALSKLAVNPLDRANHFGNNLWSSLSGIPTNVGALANSTVVAGVWTSDGVGGFSWQPIGATASLPSMSGQSGKYLTNNGATASWNTVSSVGVTNLSVTLSPSQALLNSSTGSSGTLPSVDGTNAGLMTPALFNKLAAVANNATANSADSFLLARANHTGTDPWTSLTGIPTPITTFGNLANGAGVLTNNGSGGLSWAAGGGGGGGAANLTGTAAPTVYTVANSNGTGFAIALANGTNAGLMAPGDFSKLSAIGAGATANSSDAFLLSWSNQTGKPTTAAGAGYTNGSVIDAWGAKAVPSGAIVDTTSTQTITAAKTFSAITLGTPVSGNMANVTNVPAASLTGTVTESIIDSAIQRKAMTINSYTGLTHTLSLSDNYSYVRRSHTVSCTETVPPQTTVAWPNGSVITIRNYGVGLLTVQPGAGVTFSPSLQVDVATGQSVQLIRVSSDTWDVL